MRAVVQKVSSASVSIDNKVISAISRGLVVLLGIGADDTEADVDYLTKKILSLRIFSDPAHANVMWKKSVKDIEAEILCISQFTLFANTTKGSKPDFHRAMATEPSRQMYGSFISRLGELYGPEKIKGQLLLKIYGKLALNLANNTSEDGRFGAMMAVSLTNDGPVTIIIDSRRFEYVHKGGGQRQTTTTSHSEDNSDAARTNLSSERKSD